MTEIEFVAADDLGGVSDADVLRTPNMTSSPSVAVDASRPHAAHTEQRSARLGLVRLAVLLRLARPALLLAAAVLAVVTPSQVLYGYGERSGTASADTTVNGFGRINAAIPGQHGVDYSLLFWSAALLLGLAAAGALLDRRRSALIAGLCGGSLLAGLTAVTAQQVRTQSDNFHAAFASAQGGTAGGSLRSGFEFSSGSLPWLGAAAVGCAVAAVLAGFAASVTLAAAHRSFP